MLGGSKHHQAPVPATGWVVGNPGTAVPCRWNQLPLKERGANYGLRRRHSSPEAFSGYVARSGASMGSGLFHSELALDGVS